MRLRRLQALNLPYNVAVIAIILLSCCSCTEKSVDPPPPTMGPAQFCDVSPAWSPDGQWIAFMRGGPGGSSTWGLYKVKSDGTQETKLLDWANSHGILTIDWSEQDWLLVSTFNATVYKVRPNGRGKTVLYNGSSHGASWSPSGDQVVFRRNWVLWVMDSAGQNQRVLDPQDTSPSLHPDWGASGQIIHLRSIAGAGGHAIAQIHPQTLAVEVLDSGYSQIGISYPKYANHSGFVYIRRDDGIHAQLWQVDSAFAQARCITCTDVYNEGAGEYDIFHATGEVVFANSKHGGLSIMSADGTNWRQITDPRSLVP